VDSHNIQEFLGVDVGRARVGIARGNSAARLAQPLKTVAAAQAVTELIKLANENQAAAIVVGLPRGLDGAETAQTESVRHWAKQLASQTSLAIYWQDEALTTQQAQNQGPEPAAGNDAVAAAIILQDFLDSPENDRVTV
jgi:putative holliday junction resolvase